MAQKLLPYVDIFWRTRKDEDKLLPFSTSMLWVFSSGEVQPNNAEPPLLLQPLHFELFELHLQQIRTEEGEPHCMRFCLEECFIQTNATNQLGCPEVPTGCQSQPLFFGHVLPPLWTVKKNVNVYCK